MTVQVPVGAPRPCTEDDACAAALAALGPSPARLRKLLAGRSGRDAWEAVLAGTHPADPDRRSHRLAAPHLPAALARRCQQAAVEVVVLGSERYPQRLGRDPEAPAVLFVRGDSGCGAGRPAVAVVGTRSATAAGRETALDMGRVLAEAGVVVVSGLAPGIDLAALSGTRPAEGTCSASATPAIAVLGSAHDDLVRPEQRRTAVALSATGAVLSELPPGAPSARWRFAVRNRILVGLADLVVVVECHRHGGALHTVAYARRRGVRVAAVPGSTASSASEGANALLVEGAACVRGGPDVVALLEQVTGWRPVTGACSSGPVRAEADAPALGELDARVLEAVGADPVTLDGVVLGSGVALASAALALEELGARGLVEGEGGFWWRRAGAVARARRRRTSG